MKLRNITSYLDSLFQVVSYSNLDRSFSRRMHLFPPEIIPDIVPSFLQCYNGLMIESSVEIEMLIVSCFLSEELIQDLRSSGIHDSLLFCHHMLDIDAGSPGRWDAKGFMALSLESFDYLKKNNISVYILHLPLDANASIINTHLALCHKLELLPYNNLLPRLGYSMGYIANASRNWISLIESSFSSKLVFGHIPSEPPTKVAVLAGMVSSVSMLEEIVATECTCLVCGDVLLRQKTKRAEEIFQWLTGSPIPIICFSHKETEELALFELLYHINSIFPILPTRFLRGGAQWK